MKKSLVALLITAFAFSTQVAAETKKPAAKPAAAKKAEKAPKKVHPKFEHKKAEKKKVPTRDNSKMPTPPGGPSK
jgi:uncharacterized protein involved in copper resistance